VRSNAHRIVLIPIVLLASLVAPTALQAQPNHPEPQAVTLDPSTTALLVLDLSFRCNPPDATCHALAPVINDALPKFRAANVYTVFTVSAGGAPLELWEGFPALAPNEMLIAPDATDKFFTGDLPALLADRGIKTVVITGSSANQAVLYTASSAARNFGYDVVIPLDGTNANRDYEYEYTMHQFTVVSFANRFRFTSLDMIDVS